MKKKLFGIMLVLAVILFAGYTVYNSHGDIKLSDVTLANLEALADENDDIYVVEKGDTLAIISKKMYGDVNHVDAISRMNGLQNGNLIYIGQKLILP